MLGWNVVSRGTASASSRIQVAVLPLARYDTAADVVPEALADAVTDGLIAELARHPAVEVASRTSVMPFRDRRVPLATIATALSVQAVVEGRIQVTGSRLWVEVRLVDAKRDRKVWVDDFAGDTSDRRELERRVAAALARVLTERFALRRRMSVYHSDPGGDVAKKKKASKRRTAATPSAASRRASARLLGNAEKQWRAWEGPRDAVVKAVTDVRDRAAALLSEMGAAAEAAAGKGSKKGKKKDKKEKKGKKAKKAKAEKAAAEKAAAEKAAAERAKAEQAAKAARAAKAGKPAKAEKKARKKGDAGRWPRGPRPPPLPPPRPLRPPPPPRPARRQNSDPARARSSGG